MFTIRKIIVIPAHCGERERRTPCPLLTNEGRVHTPFHRAPQEAPGKATGTGVETSHRDWPLFKVTLIAPEITPPHLGTRNTFPQGSPCFLICTLVYHQFRLLASDGPSAHPVSFSRSKPSSFLNCL